MAQLVIDEEERQASTLCLIASENYASPLAVGLEGSIFANKNAEGYPGRRYVGGVELADKVENLAKDRIAELFGAEHVNVQSMSATVGNVAILRGVLKPGDTILSMELDHGGHLSHGAAFHYSGKEYNAVFYGVNEETEMIDMEQVEALAKEYKPKLIICGASSYPRQIDYKRFAEIAHENDALLFADIAHPVGLIIAGIVPSPFPHADIVSTSTHKTWRGSRGGGVVMCKKKLARKIDSAIFPGIQGAPKMDMIAARAVQAKESATDLFKEYQQQVAKNAQVLAEELTNNGLRLVSGGTDTHLILVDVRNLIESGQLAEQVLESVGIVTNKNMIPFDPQPASVSSGLRIGTPALTTRGFKEDDIKKVAKLIVTTLKNKDDEYVLAEVKQEVDELIKGFPLFSDEWLAK
ncbi:serine hydroxymethyltransferase [Fundicoccus culcitae]|uniref:Serine hydroxymethyltransferase n=2 Tax=Fundicoccus culcitae TaxID=2969821 RepID=A0ABY5PAN5_9LACT|nr:serine hydroxymethyltransferase [Fundicoccus culcitae]